MGLFVLREVGRVRHPLLQPATAVTPPRFLSHPQTTQLLAHVGTLQPPEPPPPAPAPQGCGTCSAGLCSPPDPGPLLSSAEHPLITTINTTAVISAISTLLASFLFQHSVFVSLLCCFCWGHYSDKARCSALLQSSLVLLAATSPVKSQSSPQALQNLIRADRPASSSSTSSFRSNPHSSGCSRSLCQISQRSGRAPNIPSLLCLCCFPHAS